MLQWKNTTVPGLPVIGTGSGLSRMIRRRSAFGTTHSRYDVVRSSISDSMYPCTWLPGMKYRQPLSSLGSSSITSAVVMSGSAMPSRFHAP
jgi:hypothetical protein